MLKAKDEKLISLTQQRLEPPTFPHVNARTLATCNRFSSTTAATFLNQVKSLMKAQTKNCNQCNIGLLALAISCYTMISRQCTHKPNTKLHHSEGSITMINYYNE